MTYSTLLVHLELSQTNTALLQAAPELAERFSAAVVGIVACQPMLIVYDDGYAYAYAYAYADLILTGAPYGNAANGTRRMSAGDLVMQAGRPVLVVPPVPRDLRLDRITFGWQDTREARRPVADALPLLGKASHVNLAEIANAAELPAAPAS